MAIFMHPNSFGVSGWDDDEMDPIRRAFDAFFSQQREMSPSQQQQQQQACSSCAREQHQQHHQQQRSTSAAKGNRYTEKEAANAAVRQKDLRHLTDRIFDDFLQFYHDRRFPQGNMCLWNEGNLPFSQYESSPFEVRVNLRDCDPDKVKVEVKDGFLKVEGRKESDDGSFTYIKHQRTIPKGVSPSSLQASLLPQGVLRVVGKEEERSKTLPITVDKDSNKQLTEDDKAKGKTENN